MNRICVFLFINLYILTPLQSVHKKDIQTDFIYLIEKIQQRSIHTKEELYDRLWQLYQNPLDLNQASQQDLVQLSILSEKQVITLLEYIEKNGPLSSIYELQVIPEWDLKTISLLKHFVKVQKPDNFSTLNNRLLNKQKLTTSFESPLYTQPIKTKELLGNPHKLLMSYTKRLTDHYSIGILTKKDNGEPITKSQHYYLPYWAGHLMIENRGFIQKFIIGHYQVGFGQGLIVKSGFNMDKNAECIYILRTNQQGIRPTTSYSKKNGFQGFATKLTKENLQATFYISKRSLDAKLHQKPSGENYVTNITTRGVPYKDPDQLEKKDTLQEQILGATLTYTPNTDFELGIQAIDYRYNHPIQPKKNYYNADFFTGKHGSNLGIFSRMLWQNIHFFGEAATSQNQGKAMLAGAMISLGKWADTAFLWRYYTPDFHAMYGKAFGRNTHNRNEHGLYLGLKLYPIKHLCIASYIDFFKHAKPKYRAHTSTQGTHWLLSMNYQPTRKTLLHIKFRNNRQPYNRPKISTFNDPILDIHQRSVLHIKLDYILHPLLQARTQAQLCRYLIENKDPKYGFGLMQSFVHKKNQITLKAHLAYFNAKTYGSRIYFYIPNFMSGFKYPMLYGHGIQTGCAIAYSISQKIQIKIGFALNFFVRKDESHLNASLACKVVFR